MRSRTWLVAALLFGSGFCALVYQVAWLRDFRLIFGVSTAASAAVLAIVIGGLGLGGLLLGPRVDRHPRPLLFYAQLESIVAIAAASTPLLLAAIRTIYIASGGSDRMGATFATIARLILATLVLAVPTIAMGGTLPAAARGVTGEGDVRRHDVAMLYGVNTLGGVAGCVVATFWLLEIFGTRSTIWLAAGINMLVAILAQRSDRLLAVDAAQHPGSHAPHLRAQAPAHPGTLVPSPFIPFVLTASALVGFAFFLLELVWYRLLAPLLGGSVFTFGLVLALALAGIGVGGLLYALIADDEPATLSAFGLSCLIEAAAVAATFAMGDRIALLALVMLPLQSAGFVAHVAGWTLVAGLIVLPPALVAGYQFPMLIALLGRGRERVGRHVGLTYAANTVGAVIGALVGGFGLLPLLSAPGAWRMAAAVLLLLGVAAVIVSATDGSAFPAAAGARHWFGSSAILPGGVAVVTIVLLASTGPTAVWRHSGIGAGRTRFDVLAAPNNLHAWSNLRQRGVVWEADGVESGVALVHDPSGYSFIVNGKSDGSARGDSGTQVMLGLVGALTVPNPRRALVIGLGTGSSAGWLAAIPSIERVDVVELEPLIVDVARVCESVNHNALHNPKIHVRIGDARETLLTSNARFDLIASEPSNPFRAGIASLFTLDYYRAAARRLEDDGVFVQWVQAYEIDGETLRTVYATMSAVFPQVETWQTQRADLLLVGSKRRHTYSARTLAARIAEEPFRGALADTWRAVDLNGLLSHYLANDLLARSFATARGVQINTDDRNIVEFGLARSVGRPESGLVAEVRQLARASNTGRPPLDDEGGISWPAVDTAWVEANAAQGSFAGLTLQGPPAEQARQLAILQYHQNGDVAAARRSWRMAVGPPRDPNELMMLADVEVNAASSAALPLIQRLRAFQPAEADVLLAKLRLGQSRPAEAASALESAFRQFHYDPWPVPQMKQLALDLARAVVGQQPSLAGRMFAALEKPFQVHAVEDARLIARAELSMHIDEPRICANAVGALEPNVPWTLEFLILRRDCYARGRHAATPLAERDLVEFAAREGQPLSSLVSPASH